MSSSENVERFDEEDEFGLTLFILGGEDETSEAPS